MGPSGSRRSRTPQVEQRLMGLKEDKPGNRTGHLRSWGFCLRKLGAPGCTESQSLVSLLCDQQLQRQTGTQRRKKPMGEQEASHVQHEQQLPFYPIHYQPTWSHFPTSLTAFHHPRRPRCTWTQAFCPGTHRAKAL